jgi:hypothetical protein
MKASGKFKIHLTNGDVYFARLGYRMDNTFILFVPNNGSDAGKLHMVPLTSLSHIVSLDVSE